MSTKAPNEAVVMDEGVALAPDKGEPPAPEALATASGPMPAVRPTMEFDPDDPIGLYMNTSVFDQLQRVAVMMSKAGTVPTHLQNKVPDCFLVAAQAFRWRMDPFAVAQLSYVLNGRLGYEGKLVAAVINSDRRVARRLDYTYSGSGTDRKVVVTTRLRGEDKDRSIEGTVGQWQTTHDDKWKKNPDQMLAYRGAREWARRHAPEILLGVSTEDELPRETVTLVPRKDGSFGAPPPATPDPLLAAAEAPAPAADDKPAEPPVAKEPPTIIHPPVTPPPAPDPEPSGAGPFGKAVQKVMGRRGDTKPLLEE